MTDVFICYRSGEGAFAATLLDDRLSAVFGADHVFRATRSIAPGEDYEEAIRRALKAADVVVILIDSNWLSAADEAGTRLLDRPDDWVRAEVCTALENGIPMIPVLLERATRLRERDLPADLASLARRQFLRFQNRSLDRDATLIAEAINRRAPSRLRSDVLSGSGVAREDACPDTIEIELSNRDSSGQVTCRISARAGARDTASLARLLETAARMFGPTGDASAHVEAPSSPFAPDPRRADRINDWSDRPGQIGLILASSVTG